MKFASSSHTGKGIVRKILAVIAWAAIVALWALTVQAIYGAHPLPARIPIHFDIAGNINGWGGPRTLWLLPIIATFTGALLTLVSRYPQSFNYPVPVTPLTRPRLEAISLSMVAWLRVELASLFLWIQYAIIRSARTGKNALSLLLLLFAIACVLATVIAHIVASARVARVGAGG
jgi:Protein of unknown function (DUF1648)